MRQCMAGFQRGDDTLQRAAELECLQRLDIGDGDVFGALRFVQPGVFGTDTGVIQPRRDAEAFQNLPILVLKEVSAVAVQHTGATAGKAGTMLHLLVNALAARFDTNDPDRSVVQERIEEPHRVRSAADRGDDRVRQPTFGLVQLAAGFLADDRLEIAHHRRVWVGARHRSDAVERVTDIGDPVAQRVVHRVLQRASTRGDGDDFGAQKPHAEDIGCLSFDIVRAHVDHAFQAKLGTDRCRRYTVLSGAGLGDDAGLAHTARENDLPQNVVDLVRASMVQLVALHVDLGAAQMLGQPLSKIEGRGAANVMGPEVVHLGPEALVGARALVLCLQLQDKRHQGFTDETPAEIAEAAAFVGASHVAVDPVVGHRVLLRPGGDVAPVRHRVKWRRRRMRPAASLIGITPRLPEVTRLNPPRPASRAQRREKRRCGPDP